MIVWNTWHTRQAVSDIVVPDIWLSDCVIAQAHLFDLTQLNAITWCSFESSLRVFINGLAVRWEQEIEENRGIRSMGNTIRNARRCSSEQRAIDRDRLTPGTRGSEREECRELVNQPGRLMNLAFSNLTCHNIKPGHRQYRQYTVLDHTGTNRISVWTFQPYLYRMYSRVYRNVVRKYLVHKSN